MKVDLDKMELPEWDVAKATPIRFPLKKKKELIFEIPTVEKYFDFEALYVKYLAKNFMIFKSVDFLDYKDFKDKKLISKMVKELYRVMQIKKAQKEFIYILNKYFRANFNINRIMKYADPLDLAKMFLLVHRIIETVKKNFHQATMELLPQVDQMLGGSSISSKGNSGKIVPRF